MSYSIIYDKQFIKVRENSFIPLILCGDNNLYEGNGKRVRDWSVFSHILDGGIYGSLEYMLKKSEEIKANIISRNKEYNDRYKETGQENAICEYTDDKFGWFDGIAIGGKHTSKTTYGDFVNIFKSGVKNAITIEEAIEKFYVSFRFKTSSYDDEKLKDQLKEPVNCQIKTTEELIKKYEELSDYLKNTGVNLCFNVSASEEFGKRVRRIKSPVQKRQKSLVPVDFFFVVKDMKTNNYVAKLNRNGYSYGHSYQSAKHFAKEKEANKYVVKLNDKFGEEKRFITEKINQPKTLLI